MAREVVCFVMCISWVYATEDGVLWMKLDREVIDCGLVRCWVGLFESYSAREEE